MLTREQAETVARNLKSAALESHSTLKSLRQGVSVYKHATSHVSEKERQTLDAIKEFQQQETPDKRDKASTLLSETHGDVASTQAMRKEVDIELQHAKRAKEEYERVTKEAVSIVQRAQGTPEAEIVKNAMVEVAEMMKDEPMPSSS